MYVPINKDTKDWTNYTLVVPAVCVGNVGQLCADLLVATLGMDCVGYLYDDSFLPVIGNDPYAKVDTNTCNLVTAAEVYESAQLKLVVIQQRSPLVKGKRQQYIEKLMSWIQDSHFSQTIILSSCHSHERLDSQLTGTQLRYLMTQKLHSQEGKNIREDLNWVELERRTNIDNRGSGECGQDIFIPGGGIAKGLYVECEKAGLSATVVLLFCAEGDNAFDAINLATYVNSWKNWIDLKKAKETKGASQSNGWLIPSSWILMYGSKFDQSLFR